MKNKVKQKLNDLKYKIKQKYYDVRDWAKNNKDEIIKALPVMLTILGTILKYSAKMLKRWNENKLHNRYIYDRSAGHYWYCKRNLTKRDYLEIERRRTNGEPYGVILKSLGLI